MDRRTLTLDDLITREERALLERDLILQWAFAVTLDLEVELGLFDRKPMGAHYVA